MIQGNLFGFRPGQTLIHRPTGRPVELVAIREDSIEVNTLDDTWPHPKTGRPWGGSKWILLLDDLAEFDEA